MPNISDFLLPHFAIGGAVGRSGTGVYGAAPQQSLAPQASGGINWSDPSFGAPTGGYDASANQTPHTYGQTPTPTTWNPYGVQVGADGNPLRTGPTGEIYNGPQGTRPSSIDPTRGDLNNAQNPNLNSGDITRMNRGGPGFMGNGYYINDPTAYRLAQADPMRQAYQGMFSQAQGAMDPNAQTQWRGQQQQLAQGLFDTIGGKQPSVAAEQLKQTTQGNVANAYAMSQSGRYNPAAAKMAATNAGSINQQAAGQGALLRAQEIQNAQGMLGGVLGQGRQQDLGAYGQYGQQALGSMQGLSGINQSMLNARMNQEAQQQNAFYGTAGHAIGGQLLNAGLQAAGSVASMAAMAHGGQVKGKVMGDTICAGCGRMNSDCECYKRALAMGGPVVPGYAPGGTVDSERNDTVAAWLSPKEIVLPRSVTLDPEAPEKAMAFVAAIKKNGSMRRAA